MLETPWRDLDPELQQLWLWGTGDEHITFTWRQAALRAQIRRHVRRHHSRAAVASIATRKSKMQLRQLEKYMQRDRAAPTATAQRLNPQARAVTVTTRASAVRRQARPARCRKFARLPVSDAAEFFSELELDATRQA